MTLKKFTLNALTLIALCVPFGIGYTFLHNEIAPSARQLMAFAQTGATGPTGPTGAKGATGSGGTTFNNHVLYSGSAPTISNCGVTPTVGTGAVDNAGLINIGASTKNSLGQVVPVLQCTLTFAVAFANPPSMTFATNIKALAVTFAGISTTAVTVYFNKDAGSNQFSYHAI
jgi:hypothetical protein